MAGPARASTPSAPPGPLSLATSLQRPQAAIVRNPVESAEEVFDADDSFKAGSEIRSCGQFVGHVANSLIRLCAAGKGEATPNTEDFEKAPAKAALVVIYMRLTWLVPPSTERTQAPKIP